jgi:hypothetical protein|tara:strand:+ start:140 stop:415 length:276 start_codon:yes stop_codon:yes gene_type:complete
MCAPPVRRSRPTPQPQPEPQAPTPSAEPKKIDTSARRVGKTLRQASPSQRGRGILIRSRNPLGITNERRNLGQRTSLLTLIPQLEVDLGNY